jgi:hypothetical protein
VEKMNCNDSISVLVFTDFIDEFKRIFSDVKISDVDIFDFLNSHNPNPLSHLNRTEDIIQLVELMATGIILTTFFENLHKSSKVKDVLFLTELRIEGELKEPTFTDDTKQKLHNDIKMVLEHELEFDVPVNDSLIGKVMVYLAHKDYLNLTVERLEYSKIVSKILKAIAGKQMKKYEKKCNNHAQDEITLEESGNIPTHILTCGFCFYRWVYAITSKKEFLEFIKREKIK